MTTDSNSLLDDCFQDMVEHLKTNPRPCWRDIRGQHPNISERSFYQLVREARMMPATNAQNASPDAVTPSDATAQTNPPIRAARPGRGAMPGKVQYVDVMQTLRDLMLDAEMLRETALPIAADGKIRINGPAVFGQSIRMRRDIAKAMIDSWEQALNLDHMKLLFDLILEEIGKESPDLAYSIMKRLKEALEARGHSFGT